METLERWIETPILGGTSLADLLTLEWLLGIAGNLIAAIAMLLATIFLAGFVKRRIEGISQRHPRLDDTLFTFLGNLARYAVLAFGLVFVLNRFGVQTASIIAVIGAAGLAIGLALQGTLSNIAAGVMIIIFRPFNKGQFVEVAGKMGTVRDISIFTTELASLDNVQHVIPNSEVWGRVITNFSAYPTRRIEWIFGVSYGANLADAERIIRDVLFADPRALAEPEPWVQVTALGDFSVDFTVRVWCQAGDFWAFKTDGTRAVKEAFDAAGIEIPFPTRTVIERAETAA